MHYQKVILGTSFSILLLSMIYPFVYFTDWNSTTDASLVEKTVKFPMAGLAQFVVSAFVCRLSAAGISRRPGRVQTVYLLLLAVLCGWFLATSIWSINPLGSFVYSIALILLFFAFDTFWQLNDDEIRWTCNLAGCFVIAGILYLAASLPLNTRTLGGITPNALGHIGLGSIFLSFFMNRYFSMTCSLFGLCLIVYCQSRTALVTLSIFIFLYLLIGWWVTSRKRLLTAIIITITSIPLGLTFYSLGSSWLQSVTSKVLAVETESRLDESFTGRTIVWSEAIILLRGHELAGYGFRTRQTVESSGPTLNAHSGLINCALDNGAIGLFLFLLTICAAVFFLSLRWIDEKDQRARICAAFVAAMVPILVAEPVYINLATSTSILFLMGLISPLRYRFDEQMELESHQI